MILFVFVSLLLVHCEMAVGQKRVYFHVMTPMHWADAQDYCRQHYEDLAIVTSDEENQRLINLVAGTSVYGWIGLVRIFPLSPIWKWADGNTATFFKWYTDQPTNSLFENCANAGPLGWNDQDCSNPSSFFCYKTMIMVKENKTWIEALQDCSRRYNNLASLTSQTQLDVAETLAAGNQVPMVWTGLRFLDGKWFWLSKEQLETNFNLPSCPAMPHQCGARNFKADIWENQDCNMKLNYLCY